jgi:hypothetical protein
LQLLGRRRDTRGWRGGHALALQQGLQAHGSLLLRGGSKS